MFKCLEPDCDFDGDTEQALASHHHNAHVRVYERKPIAHGTTGGYQAHRRRAEQPCSKCLEAWRTYHRNKSSRSRK